MPACCIATSDGHCRNQLCASFQYAPGMVGPLAVLNANANATQTTVATTFPMVEERRQLPRTLRPAQDAKCHFPVLPLRMHCWLASEKPSVPALRKRLIPTRLILAFSFAVLVLPRCVSSVMSSGSLLPRCLSAPLRRAVGHRSWALPQVNTFGHRRQKFLKEPHGLGLAARTCRSWQQQCLVLHNIVPVHAGREAAIMGSGVDAPEAQCCRCATTAGSHQLLSTNTCVPAATNTSKASQARCCPRLAAWVQCFPGVCAPY